MHWQTFNDSTIPTEGVMQNLGNQIWDNIWRVETALKRIKLSSRIQAREASVASISFFNKVVVRVVIKNRNSIVVKSTGTFQRANKAYTRLLA